LTVEAQAGTSLTLTQSGILGGDLTKAGAGTLMIGDGVALTGALNLNEGVLEVAPNVLAFRGRDVTLAADTQLRASGSLNRRVFGDATSTLEAMGNVDIGDLDSADGYAFGGRLTVGPHMVVGRPRFLYQVL
jgi:hypothetical protein